MSDSNERDALAAKHEEQRARRLKAIIRWVEYIRETPAETWGPQQNAVVNAQLQSARATGLSAEHYRRIRRSADSPERDESVDNG